MKKNNKNSINQNFIKEQEAYKTLQDWVKSVPRTIQELEKQGDKEQLIKYKKQVKMVLQKLEDIKSELENEN